MDTELRFAELTAFIKEQTRANDYVITRETRIEDDLGITGEEASELIQSFSKRYGINISNFQFDKYFNDEPSVFLSPREVQPFKVGYFEKAILKGRLDEEVINS